MSTSLTNDFARQCFYVQCNRYWQKGIENIQTLPLAKYALPTQEPLPPKLHFVELPSFATHLGDYGKLPVPEHLLPTQKTNTTLTWKNIDWPLVGFWFLNCLAERAYEEKYGSIHSYNFKLKEWDARLWQKAWVNRIALFLRLWAAQTLNTDEEELFGSLPEAKILLTHDVDAIRKTLAIRCKQTAFNGFNALRFASKGQWSHSFSYMKKACSFFCSKGKDWGLENILQIYERQERKGIFLFPGQKPKPLWKSPKKWLFDPSYDVAEMVLPIQKLLQEGHKVGVHPSFEHYDNGFNLYKEVKHIENTLKTSITCCRQHWLRFSFAKTWTAQKQAGITDDYTLGFNDLSGFRNGAALAHPPLDNNSKILDSLVSWPIVLMDSQLYDYANMNEETRQEKIRSLIDEIRFVRGQATVLWHPHSLSKDYGWGEGFEALIKIF